MAFGMIWFIGSSVIANIMKTGAFEVFVNGELWTARAHALFILAHPPP
jgi:hypothetical protein